MLSDTVDEAKYVNDSYSQFSPQHRIEAKAVLLSGIKLMLANADSITYSEGADRWDWFHQGLRVAKGEFPTTCDCSSTDSWLLWNALTHVKGLDFHDIVNFERWLGGFTGTMTAHGKLVTMRSNLVLGDQVFYAKSFGGGIVHVATYTGGGYVFSHGDDPPIKTNIDRMGGLVAVQYRRYI
jgi:hypothetical protein